MSADASAAAFSSTVFWAVGFSLGTGMRRLVDRLEMVAGEMGVHLGRRQVGVAEQLLDGAQVGAAFEQVGGVRVTQRVWVQRPAVVERVALEDATCVPRGERAAPPVEEH